MRDFNPETQSDSYAEERRIALAARGRQFETTVALPLYIRDRLRSDDWDKIVKNIRERFEQYCANAEALIRNGADSTDQWRTVGRLTSQYAREHIYEVFSDAQLREGNGAWEVPHSLQSHTVN